MNHSSNQSTNRNLCLDYEYISSGISGPILGIIAITHGNEIAGLKIFDQLKKTITLNKGTIILIPSNIDAYENYIKQQDPLKCRFIDHDMNRIWDESYIEGSSEYQRRDELKKILLECDIIIDIHSVSKGDDVLGIVDPVSIEDARRWMDTEKILIQSENDNSMTAWCTRQGKISFGLEAGNHISKQGIKNGIRNIENMLVYFGMIDGNIEKSFPAPDALEFLVEIKVSSDNFKYARDFESFNILSPNEIIAYDGGNEIKNPYPYAVIYGLVTQRPEKGKSAGFLFQKQ